MLIVGLLWTALAASDAKDVALKAEAHFRAGCSLPEGSSEALHEFRDCATAYEELRRLGPQNPDLNRNLGNAWALAGQWHRAILAYRRGLRVAPSDAGLQEGLAFARSQVAYSSSGAFGRPSVEERPPWLPRIPSPWYLALAIAAWGLAWAAAARWWMVRRNGILGLAGLGFLIALALLIALCAEEWRDHLLRQNPIVVIADDGVLLRGGNGFRYPARYETPLNRGVEARLLFIRGDWLQIELSGGEVGWVPRAYALVDDS